MSAQDNIRIAKEFFAAAGQDDKQALAALSAEDIEWTIPGEWAWAGTYRGHKDVADFMRTSSDTVEISSSTFRDFVAQGDRVFVTGIAAGKIKATNRMFDDHFVFDFTVRDGKVARIREYVDTLALARASATPANPLSRRNS